MSPVPLNVVEAERAQGSLTLTETDCVQGPLMLSETCTWPGALYWPNHPTSRSLPKTGSLRVKVYDARRWAGEAAAPWTNWGETAGVLTVAGAERAGRAFARWEAVSEYHGVCARVT